MNNPSFLRSICETKAATIVRIVVVAPVGLLILGLIGGAVGVREWFGLLCNEKRAWRARSWLPPKFPMHKAGSLRPLRWWPAEIMRHLRLPDSVFPHYRRDEIAHLLKDGKRRGVPVTRWQPAISQLLARAPKRKARSEKAAHR